jgi:hypothetical protein
MRELVQTHECELPNGDIVEVFEYVHIRSYQPLDGPPMKAKGAIEYELEDGGPVNAVAGDPNAFQLVMTDEIVRKIADD